MSTENKPSSQEFLQTCEQAFVKDLFTLTSIDSGTDNKTGIDQVVALVDQRARAWGMEVILLPQKNCGDFLTVAMQGESQGKVLLLAHSDTVYPKGTVAKRPTTIEDNRITGPGVCDMKSSLLSALYAMRALQTEGFSDFGEITLFVNSDEEIGSPYSVPVYAPVVRQADAVLVLEPARENGDIVSSRKGIGHFNLKIEGLAAHAGINPNRGVNAIYEMGHLLVRLEEETRSIREQHPGITINPGVIEGGTKTNVVPDHALLQIEARVADLWEQEIVQALLSQLANETTNPKAVLSLSGKFSRSPMAKTRATAFLVEQAKQVGRQLGIELNDRATGGASDANVVSQLGIPVLDGLGPVGGNAHSPQEYILKDSLVPRTMLLAGLIKNILEHRDKLSGLAATS